MAEIRFSSPETFSFLQHYSERLQSITAFHVNEANLTYSIENPVVSELVERINAALPTILPLVRDDYDEWVIVAASQTDLDQTLQQMNRFLLPTFGIYSRNSLFPRLEQFSHPVTSLFNQYYSWQAPHSMRLEILTALGLWLKVMKQAPDLGQMLPPTFKVLYRQFRFAVTSYNWIEAEQIIDQLQRNHLTPSHNIAFLKIELLAQQEDYKRIWNDDALKQWVFHSVPIPRRVQVALLKAFHHQNLLQDEQNGRYDVILNTLRHEQGSLGKLLLSRQDVIDDIVVRVFGYVAVLNKTPESLAILRQISTLDSETSAILSTLQTLIQPVILKDPLERFHELFNGGQYETAYGVAEGIETLTSRVAALILSAANLDHEARAREALKQYDQLGQADQTIVLNKPSVKPLLKTLLAMVPQTPDIYTDWLSWFEAMFEGADSAILHRSLDYLEQNSDKEYWGSIHTEELFGYLGTMTFDPEAASSEDRKLASYPYFERAMDWLINQFVVEDHDFPREPNIFGDLYKSFLEYVLYLTPAREETSDRVLRLADDQFTRNPNKNQTLSQLLFMWLGPPRPNMINLASDTFELSIQHGVGKEHLYIIYNKWVSHLLDAPISYNVSALEVWNSLGQWFGDAAIHLTRGIRERLEVAQSEAIDPIAQLRDGFHIVIYTLDETSAKRVEMLLLERQPALKIDLYTGKSVTDRMNTLTQNADMHVVVWRCMKHNVYYKIKSYINDMVLPASRGSSSILSAIEQEAQKIIM